MTDIKTYDKLEEFGRVRLSSSFFMRDFLYSEIGAWHQMRNVPEHPDVAIAVGKELCSQLLEPLQATFGRLHIRSGYRSPAVNDFGNRNQLNCASNESNYAAHIWDYPNAEGLHGATACIVVPWLVDHIARGGQWTDMAWWIHDHLPYSSLYFFPKLAAFNVSWHQKPARRIDSYASPKGCLTRPSMANHEGSHAEQYVGLPRLDRSASDGLRSQRLPSEVSLVAAPTLPQPAAPAIEAGPSRKDARKSAAAEATKKRESHGALNYRAVHAKTKWRKVSAHRSLESAINGRDGAAGLFARKVRIDYEKHGDPMYVLIWEDGAEHGYMIKPDPTSVNGIRQVLVPIDLLMKCERVGQADKAVLERFF